MTTNRLAKSGGNAVTKCTFRAAEYAAIAEQNGDHEKAKLWRKADREGWDDEHYDHALALERREVVRRREGIAKLRNLSPSETRQ